jgi:hypothetical protein
VYLHQHGAPNTNYGLDVSRIDLGTSWQTYRLECTASDFIGIVRDARLRFWLAPYAEAGDQYYFNEVHLFRKADLGKPGSEPLSDVGTKPQEFALEQNYPNPFNASSHFRFWISEFAAVKLHVFDLLGREVAVLVNEKKDPGSYQVRWDASGFPSGVYIYRLQAGSFVQSRKLVLVK